MKAGNLCRDELVETQAFRKKEQRVELFAGEDSSSNDRTRRWRRVLVAGIVIAIHVAMLVSLGRGVRRPAPVAEVFLTLISLAEEEEPLQERSSDVPPPEQRESAQRRVAPATRANTAPRAPIATPEERTPPETDSSTAPVAPIDWYAEAQSTASALDQRDRANRERRPLDRPN